MVVLILKPAFYSSTMSTMDQNASPKNTNPEQEIPPTPWPPSEPTGTSAQVLDLGIFELPMKTPVQIAGFTVTLIDNNHKFQDDPYDSYVWVTIRIVSPTGEAKDIVLQQQTYKGESESIETISSMETFSGYSFVLTDIGYDYYVKVKVEKSAGDVTVPPVPPPVPM